MALVDVVVVSFNSRATLRACVEPLAGLDDVNVIVVDNASPDGSLEVVCGSAGSSGFHCRRMRASPTGATPASPAARRHSCFC